MNSSSITRETQLNLALSCKGVYWLTWAEATGKCRAGFRQEGPRGSPRSPGSCPSLFSQQYSFSLCYLQTPAALQKLRLTTLSPASSPIKGFLDPNNCSESHGVHLDQIFWLKTSKATESSPAQAGSERRFELSRCQQVKPTPHFTAI